MTYLHSDHRRILLIDQNTTKQHLRATILRNYEIEVHTATCVSDAAFLSQAHAYDLVLLAAQPDSEQATELSTQLRAIRPRQKIGLLVGPPAFVQELGGKRKKVESITAISRNPPPENFSEPVSSPHASSLQWQETIRRLVSDWYVERSAFLESAS
jgi:CheY-like chemotaxis protein